MWVEFGTVFKLNEIFSGISMRDAFLRRNEKFVLEKKGKVFWWFWEKRRKSADAVERLSNKIDAIITRSS